MGMFLLDRLAVDRTLCGPGQLRDECHLLGLVEAGDTLADEIDQIFRSPLVHYGLCTLPIARTTITGSRSSS